VQYFTSFRSTASAASGTPYSLESYTMCCAVIYPAMPLILEYKSVEDMYRLPGKRANRAVDRMPKMVDTCKQSITG